MLMPSIFRDDLFDTFFDDFTRTGRKYLPAGSAGNAMMKTDVREKEDGYELNIDLPGYQKENVQAQLKEGYLTITASRNTENEEKDEKGKFIRRERYFGNCTRSFYVGDEVEQDDIKARFENGVLIIDIPKKKPQPKIEENRYIAIE